MPERELTAREAVEVIEAWSDPRDTEDALSVLRRAVEENARLSEVESWWKTAIKENENLRAELARLKAPVTEKDRVLMLDHMERFDPGCPMCDKIRALISAPPAPAPRVTLEISEHSYLFGVMGHNYAVDHIHGRIIENILRSIGVIVEENDGVPYDDPPDPGKGWPDLPGKVEGE